MDILALLTIWPPFTPSAGHEVTPSETDTFRIVAEQFFTAGMDNNAGQVGSSE